MLSRYARRGAYSIADGASTRTGGGTTSVPAAKDNSESPVFGVSAIVVVEVREAVEDASDMAVDGAAPKAKERGELEDRVEPKLKRDFGGDDDDDAKVVAGAVVPVETIILGFAAPGRAN